MKYLFISLFAFFIFFCGCSDESRPQGNGNAPAATISLEGIDVPLDKAKEGIVGKWRLIKIAKWYSDYGLELPASLVIKKNGKYELSIILKDKGKLSYRGTWSLSLIEGKLLAIFSRTHKAFENDWKESEGKDGAIIRFLSDKLDKAIFVIANLDRHKLEFKKDRNMYWVKVKKRS
jgi:hypothetical protein